jgi:hypothetical protein
MQKLFINTAFFEQRLYPILVHTVMYKPISGFQWLDTVFGHEKIRQRVAQAEI